MACEQAERLLLSLVVMSADLDGQTGRCMCVKATCPCVTCDDARLWLAERCSPREGGRRAIGDRTRLEDGMRSELFYWAGGLELGHQARQASEGEANTTDDVRGGCLVNCSGHSLGSAALPISSTSSA